jgi:hypothetical protein
LGNLVHVQQLIEPGVKHVIEVGRERRVEEDIGADRDRLLACIRAALGDAHVNPEVIRPYLAQARRIGLDWRELYLAAARGLPQAQCPPPEAVAPID